MRKSRLLFFVLTKALSLNLAKFSVLCGLFLVAATGKAQDSSIIQVNTPPSSKGFVIKYGIASYYASKFTGRKTASGHIYNPTKLTAACNVLPLGTWVKVTNLKNNRSVIVQINDRLHYKNKRLIDLTKTAAEQLKYTKSGITRVKVEVIGTLPKLKKKINHHKKKKLPVTSKPVTSKEGIRW